MSQYLADTVNCPLCGGKHKNPTCYVLDEENLGGLMVLCPVEEGYFRLTEEKEAV